VFVFSVVVYFQVKAGVFDEVRFLYAGQYCTRTEIIFPIPVQYTDVVRAEVPQMEFPTDVMLVVSVVTAFLDLPLKSAGWTGLSCVLA